MQDQYLQAIRHKLQKRVRRLNSADYKGFPFLLKSFFVFFDSHPLLAAVRDQMLANAPDQEVDEAVGRILEGEPMYGDTELEEAAIGDRVLRHLADDPRKSVHTQIGWGYGAANDANSALDRMRDYLLEPFYEYVDEHLDDQQAILYFLRQFKHRCEWFERDRLHALVEADPSKGEMHLQREMYRYLHDQGIELHLEPHSPSGIVDFLDTQFDEDRFAGDTKVFWPEKDKRKPYILSGYHQIYAYACDHNVPFAYLVVFKLCEEDLRFLVPHTEGLFPCLTHNNKTTFFVVVDICAYGASASKRGPMKSHEVTEEELVRAAEEEELTNV